MPITAAATGAVAAVASVLVSNESATRRRIPTDTGSGRHARTSAAVARNDMRAPASKKAAGSTSTIASRASTIGAARRTGRRAANETASAPSISSERRTGTSNPASSA
ncbi:MAG: hypothetical protein MUF70_17600 [Myxococcota bacterium]|nr:hypothetical protein [Myxococcota bacterium]